MLGGAGRTGCARDAEGRNVYASVTTTKGTADVTPELAAMAGETMVMWLDELDEFRGMLMLIEEATGTTRVISFWRDREAAERHREARMRLRDRIAASVDVEIEETVYAEVPFAHLSEELRQVRV